jgi:hypothetical protein
MGDSTMSTLTLKSPSGTVNLIPEDISGTHNVTIPSAGIVSPDSLRTELNASGTAPIYACRAWVNFNGTGTVTIRASGNVSSITDNGVGEYTVNFTQAMPNSNYSASGMSRSQGGSTLNPVIVGFSATSLPTVSSCAHLMRTDDGSIAVDPDIVTIMYIV